LLTRAHGGFGSFLPVGIRVGEDAVLPKLGQINATVPDARGRYDAAMAIADLYTVGPAR
jgi:hypothetical protein